MAASLRTADVSLHSWTNTKMHFLPTFVLKLPQGYPSAYGGALVFEQPKPSGTFTYMRTLGILFKVKKSNN